MHLALWLRIGAAMAALGGGASACGGATAGGQSARGELEQNGADRCAEACETVIRCDLGGESCSCQSCPAGDPAGCDPVCECEQPTADSCAADCSEAIDEILREKSGCEDEMLALLGCLPNAACGEDPCQSEQQRLEACGDEDDVAISKPGAPPIPVESGCAAATFGGAAGPLPPGDVACEVEWSECADGNQYGIQCVQQSETTLSCTCSVNGAVTAGVSGAFACGAGDMSQLCGWDL